MGKTNVNANFNMNINNILNFKLFFSIFHFMSPPHSSFCFPISHITCLSPHMLSDSLLQLFHFFRLNETVSSLDNIPSFRHLTSRVIPAFICLDTESKEDGSTYSLIHITVSNQCSYFTNLFIIYLFIPLFIK